MTTKEMCVSLRLRAERATARIELMPLDIIALLNDFDAAAEREANCIAALNNEIAIGKEHQAEATTLLSLLSYVREQLLLAINDEGAPIEALARRAVKRIETLEQERDKYMRCWGEACVMYADAVVSKDK